MTVFNVKCHVTYADGLTTKQFNLKYNSFYEAIDTLDIGQFGDEILESIQRADKQIIVNTISLDSKGKRWKYTIEIV
jgi:hypothetical protein